MSIFCSLEVIRLQPLSFKVGSVQVRQALSLINNAWSDDRLRTENMPEGLRTGCTVDVLPNKMVVEVAEHRDRGDELPRVYNFLSNPIPGVEVERPPGWP